jgi:hypothetical protein
MESVSQKVNREWFFSSHVGEKIKKLLELLLGSPIEFKHMIVLINEIQLVLYFS